MWAWTALGRVPRSAGGFTSNSTNNVTPVTHYTIPQAPRHLDSPCGHGQPFARSQPRLNTHVHPRDPHRQPDIATTLVGMGSVAQVDANVDAALEALGLVGQEGTGAGGLGGGEADRVTDEMLRLLAPVKDVTWPSGRPLPQVGAGAGGSA